MSVISQKNINHVSFLITNYETLFSLKDAPYWWGTHHTQSPHFSSMAGGNVRLSPTSFSFWNSNSVLWQDGGGQSRGEHQNSIIWSFFHKLFHSCSNTLEQTLAEEERKSSCQMKYLVTVSAAELLLIKVELRSLEKTWRAGNKAKT